MSNCQKNVYARFRQGAKHLTTPYNLLVGTVDRVDSLGLVVCSSITEFVDFQVFYKKKSVFHIILGILSNFCQEY